MVRALEIDRVGHGGVCTARWPDGRVVFVRHTLPGERVGVRVTQERGRYLRADAVEVLRPAPQRVPPPCPHAGPGRCGGCDWQHVDLAAQRGLKAAVIRDQFAHLAGLALEPEVLAMPEAPGGLGWRTRVRFAVGEDGSVGFHRHRSAQIEPVTRCRIAHPLVEDLGVTRRHWPRTTAVEVAVGVASGDRVVIVHPRGGVAPGDVPPLDAPAAVLVVDQADRPTSRHRGRAVVRERAAGRDWEVSGGAFWQVHPGAADVLVRTVVAMLRPRPGECALDLYCGVGLFAAALAAAVGPAGLVLAIDGDRTAAADARVNLRDLTTVSVRTARVDGRLLGRLPAAPDVVVLDPPRTGAGREVVAALARLRPRAICYVSCEPSALARDTATLAAFGYPLERLHAFDVFPMTAHVECVGLFARGSDVPDVRGAPSPRGGTKYSAD